MRAWILRIAIALCLICLPVLRSLPRPDAIEESQSKEELARNIQLWGPERCAALGFALGFDYLFMAAYVTAIGLGCAAAAGRANGTLRRLGMALAYCQVASGLIDATENATLARMLIAGFDDGLMNIARLATASKFLIPVAGTLYILVVAVSRYRKGS